MTVVLRSVGDPEADAAARAHVTGLGLDLVDGARDVVEVPTGTDGLLVFLEAGDELQPDAITALVRRMEAAGADVGLGSAALRRAGRTWRRVEPAVLADAVAPRRRAELLGVVDLRGLVVAAELWRAAGPGPVAWDGPAVAATSVLLAARAVTTTADLVVVTDETAEADLPIEERRRHRPARTTAVCRGIAAAAEALPVDLRAAHATTVVARHLRPVVVDALAGRAPAFDEVAALARLLVDHLGPVLPTETLRVEDRILVRVAGRGDVDDARAAASFLEDNPRGLPHDGTVVGPEGEDEVAPGWLTAVPRDDRLVGRADQELRVRLLAPLVVGGTWRLDGNALVTCAPGGEPVVHVDGVRAAVRPRPDVSADLWAARDHEDHGTSGFTAELGVDALPAARGDRRQVEVALGGRSVSRSVAAGPRAAPSAPVVVTAARLEGEVLHLVGRGGAVELRLTGPRAQTEWVRAEAGAEGQFSAALQLRTPFFAHVTPLPADVHVLAARAAAQGHGEPTALEVAWGEDLLRPETEWVGAGFSLRPRAPDRLAVGPPVRLVEDSARARRRRMNAWSDDGVGRLGRTVVLESFAGRSVADNPLAIARELGRRDVDVDLAWIVDDASVLVPEGSRAVLRRTPEMFDVLANAAAYVSNASAPSWWRKRPGMVHVQTWHGVPLKRIGEDRGPGDLATWRHRETVAAQAAGWDLLVSPSPWCSPIFRSAFRFGGTLLEAGQPRNDVLLGPGRDAVGARVRAELGLAPDQRVVLYAPTWRDHAGHRDAKPVHLDVPAFLEASPGTTLLVRGHYNASRQRDLDDAGHRGRVVDVTRYPDAADLLCAADALVTDYSSVMFDFCLTDRPIVLLVPDLATYRSVHPGMYFDIEEHAPGPVVADTAGVVTALEQADAYAPARARFRADFCPLDDGGSSARVVDHLMTTLAW